MSKDGRQELLRSLQPQYQRASWKAKRKLLDGFVIATGYSRKHAIVLLNRDAVKLARKRNRRRLYEDVKDAVIQVWDASNRICSKRLVPFLPVLVASMEKHEHLRISSEQREKLLALSPASMDRLLKEERRKYGKGRSRTKPGYLIKKQIAVRTFADWNDVQPGFLEADLVAHCGESVHGQFLHTLTLTDIATTWTECIALLRRSESDVMHGLSQLREILPFPLLGLDTDNGAEFINYSLLNWCTAESITFTRSREYKKNDQAHVEEKNGSVVRRLVGYDRYEGIESWRLLSGIYKLARIYVNFFQPSLKLMSKSRDGARVHRCYDRAKTPYERVLSCKSVAPEHKDRLREQFESSDPVLLLENIERLQLKFWATAIDPLPTNILAPVKVGNSTQVPSSAQQPRPPRLKRSGIPRKPAVWSGRKPGRKTNIDEVWEEVCRELEQDPLLTAAEIINLLNDRYPGRFRATQLNTVKDKLQRWRSINMPDGEWRPCKPGRKTVLDEFWPEIEAELEKDPNVTLRGLIQKLSDSHPGAVRLTQRSTLCNKVKAWRKKHILSITLLPDDDLKDGSHPVTAAERRGALQRPCDSLTICGV